MHKQVQVAIIGGGPAGLMAAEVISSHGMSVEVYDAMPSVGRKFLMAGKGGLNITHAEPFEHFQYRYGQAQPTIVQWLSKFGANEVRQWMQNLGFASFVGSSGRVFPTDMKAAPLLRAWLHRLKNAGVQFHMRHRWLGWDQQQHLVFSRPDGELTIQAECTVMALGGGSWAKLGSDGRWTKLLEAKNVEVSPLKPSNCGFDREWSEHFSERYAGQPLKNVAIQLPFAHQQFQQGECLITHTGLEGSLIYALSSQIRDEIACDGKAIIHIDLLPQHTQEQVAQAVSKPRASRSISSHLQSTLGLKGAKVGLLREVLGASDFQDPRMLAKAIKALPILLNSTRPIDEAISTAGGVRLKVLNQDLMLKHLPGVFCAGEMLDWEAPTGGYLLTACFASGFVAGLGVVNWFNNQ